MLTGPDSSFVSRNTVFYSDRDFTADIEETSPGLCEALERAAPGAIKYGKVHFVGFVSFPGLPSAVFLPRKLTTGRDDQGKRRASRLLLEAFNRFATSSVVGGGAEGEVCGADILPIIYRIAEDYVENGLVRYRRRVGVKDRGKENWKRTIRHISPFISRRGGLVFPEIVSSATIDDEDNFVCSVQRFVLGEIADSHGWWLPWDIRMSLSHRSVQIGEYEDLVRQLQMQLVEMYSGRHVRLTSDLIKYLSWRADNSSGFLLFGTKDFHVMWEEMLRKTLRGSEEGWNSKLPKPYYLDATGVPLENNKKRMITDVIIRRGTTFWIVDAKYYGASGPEDAPGWRDISKQLLYAKALKSIVPDDATIESCFAFPKAKGEREALHEIVMLNSDMTKDSCLAAQFGTVQCVYFDIEDVFVSYLNRRTDINIDDMKSL